MLAAAARRIAIGLALFVGCLVSLAAMFLLLIVAIAAVAGDSSPQQHSPVRGTIAAISTLLLATLIVSFFVWLGARLVVGWALPFWKIPLAVAPLLFIGLAFAVPSKPPDPSLGAARFLKEKWGTVRFDLLLVVDPGDRGGKAAIREARRNGLLRTAPGPRWDVRYGIAVLDPLPDQLGRWRLAQRFTGTRRAAAASLASIPPARRPPAYGGYGRLLHDVLRPGLGWRVSVTGGQQVIVFFFDRLPSSEELDSAVRREKELRRKRTLQACRERRPPEMTLQQCLVLFGTDPLPGPGTPLPWLPSWQELQIRSAADGPRLVVVTTDGNRDRQKDWRARLATVRHGRLVVLPRGRTENPVVEAERAATTLESPEALRLAFRYRPHLLFDTAERFGPRDVDGFLAESPGPVGCPTDGSRGCSPVDSGYTILREYDHLNLPGGARSGADLPTDLQATEKQRIYFHSFVTNKKGPQDYRLHLDYWWFLRFNVSPVRTRENCLAGVSFSDATCFDHEGDWEGITVTVQMRDGHLRPDSVTYAGHRELQQYGWGELDDAGVIRGDTHPAAFIAYGSHAAYPFPCFGSQRFLGGCNQGDVKLFKLFSIPEGRHNGREAWPFNDDAECRKASCLVPLPRGPRGPALWNAFDGHWGQAECTLVGRFCEKTEGPSTPAAQTRYWNPDAAHRRSVSDAARALHVR